MVPMDVGRQLTWLHNQYFMLQWGFSCVDPSGDAQDIKRSLYDHINGCIEDFYLSYQAYLPQPPHIDRENALFSIKSLIAVVRTTGHPVYLLIDEYDNFANELSVKTLFLSLLYNDTLFVMDSEPEIELRYPDLTMIVRPELRLKRFAVVAVGFERLCWEAVGEESGGGG